MHRREGGKHERTIEDYIPGYRRRTTWLERAVNFVRNAAYAAVA